MNVTHTRGVSAYLICGDLPVNLSFLNIHPQPLEAETRGWVSGHKLLTIEYEPDGGGYASVTINWGNLTSYVITEVPPRDGKQLVVLDADQI